MIIKLGVVGCVGRMGKSIMREIVSRISGSKIVLSAAASRPGSDAIGRDIGEFLDGFERGIKITSSIEKVFEDSDVIIDFSNPDIMRKCLELSFENGKPLVSGTTGFQDIDFTYYASKVPFLWSANMSMGINLMAKLLEDTARILKNKYDVEIWEMHHRNKQDSPSGTSIMLGRAVTKGWEDNDLSMQQYLCNKNNERVPNSIGFAVSRGGGIIGEHSVMFVNDDEKIEFKHTSINRSLFSKGAINAAIWLYNKSPGLYSMIDVFSS